MMQRAVEQQRFICDNLKSSAMDVTKPEGDEPMANQVGYRVLGTIKAVKGTCSVGHKVGDQLELSAHSSAGLCGFLYHDIFPYIVMLQFGGGFPSSWGDPDVVQLDCMDKWNLVTIELRRVKE